MPAPTASEPPWPPGSLMAELTADDRAALERLGKPRAYRPGSALMLEGDRDTEVSLLTDGYVKVLGGTEDGGTALLAVRARGDLVGELAAIDGHPRSATVLAVRPTTVSTVDGAAFRGLMRERPGLAAAVQRSLTAKLRATTRHRIDAGAGSATVRVARTLDTLARRYGHEDPAGLRIGIPLCQADLAWLTGLSHASVQRALRRLRQDGAVTTRYRSLVVRDLGALRATAELPGAAGG
ncbi:Crp/Fnr family transcriptional regulator [Kitasatospora sp. NPDC057015]|uniref:Crp/Fnr family transcriptional regulator n=1 Tax=Kitasatospora sp. NPDC057015 TaxID=3346001 RepID=UPI0036396CF8